jgi:hypothetical protein
VWFAMVKRRHAIPLSPCGRGVRGEGSARKRLVAARLTARPLIRPRFARPPSPARGEGR